MTQRPTTLQEMAQAEATRVLVYFNGNAERAAGYAKRCSEDGPAHETAHWRAIEAILNADANAHGAPTFEGITRGGQRVWESHWPGDRLDWWLGNTDFEACVERGAKALASLPSDAPRRGCEKSYAAIVLRAAIGEPRGGDL